MGFRYDLKEDCIDKDECMIDHTRKDTTRIASKKLSSQYIYSAIFIHTYNNILYIMTMITDHKAIRILFPS